MPTRSKNSGGHDSGTSRPVTEPAGVVKAGPQNAQARNPTEGRLAQAFAQVTAVLMRDTNFRNMRLAELEWLVLPPLLAGQWRVAQAASERKPAEPKGTQSAGSVLMPVGAALWARVSPDIDRRLSGRPEQPLQLKPGEWTSGEITWLITVAGVPAAIPTFLNLLQEREFEGREVKLRARAEDGSAVVTTLREHARALADRVQQPSRMK